MRVQLRETASVKLNGSGAGTAKVGPLTAREVWHPDNASVNANQNPTLEAQCQILIGDSNTLRFRDSTFSGSSGDSTDKVNADTLHAGEFVWAIWSGGDANQQATLTVTGTKDV